MDKISSRIALGMTGSLLLMFGLFTPLLSIPIMGSINYMQIGQEGYLLLVLALAAVGLLLARWRRSLIAVSVVTLGLTLLRLVLTQVHLSKMKADMASELSDNPFAGLAQLAANSVHLEWGWLVLISGSVLLGLSALMPISTPTLVVETTPANTHIEPVSG